MSRKPKGTHGSLSKAGKTRDVKALKRRWRLRREAGESLSKGGNPMKHRKKHSGPRVNNRKRYKNQILLKRVGNKQ